MKCTYLFLAPPRQATSQQLDMQHSNPEYIQETKAVLYCICMFKEPAGQDTVGPSVWFLAYSWCCLSFSTSELCRANAETSITWWLSFATCLQYVLFIGQQYHG